MIAENFSLTIDILVNAIRINEATGDHTIALARTLIALNYRVRIFAGVIGTLPVDISPLATQADAKSYPADGDMLIVQYAVWHPLVEVLRSCTIPSIFYYHGVTPPEYFPDSARQGAQRNSRFRTDLVFQASCAVCTSPFTAKELVELTGYPAEQIHVIPLPFELAAFAAPVEAATLNMLRQKLQLEGKRVLLYIGRISEHKRIDLLIDAVAILKTDFPELHLLIVGNTGASNATQSLADALMVRAERQHITSAVTFSGAVDSVVPYYRLADIYVQSSQHEGFCVPVVEAMAMGVPIVASNAGALPWLLQFDQSNRSGSGLIFQSGNLDDLALQLRRLLLDSDLRAELSKRGKKRVRDFSSENFAKNVCQAVDNVLSSEMAQNERPQPQTKRENYHTSALFAAVDVSLRDYKVRSEIPLLGRWVEWIRRNSTSHLKEAYLDLIVEQQVNYNRQMAEEIERLQSRVEVLQCEIIELRRQKAKEKQ